MTRKPAPAHTVTRIIHFCYGHRLLGHRGKCLHLHGHNGVIEITLRRGRLDRMGMVMDFERIKATVEKWVKAELDHRMLLNRRDPLAPILRRLGEPVVALSGNPTAENIARLIYARAKAKRLPVLSVRLWETRDSCAHYGVRS
ncbi:MAG TPA: 6-pyruvoyl tetrahydrobiopterin synthase [Elusimicrobia bacterium]|nr:6-pyruvoyl tetrahydrobiopterin synthase [Elusimicrobiota bacterium]